MVEPYPWRANRLPTESIANPSGPTMAHVHVSSRIHSSAGLADLSTRLLQMLCLCGCLLFWPVERVEAEPGALRLGDAGQYPFAPHIAYLKDSTGTLVIEDMGRSEIQHGFQPLGGEQASSNFGLTTAHIWLRLDLHSATNTPRDWLLEVGHASLDRIELFVSQPQGGFQRYFSGDQLAFKDRPLPHRNHVFPLQLRADTDYRLYLRVASSGTLSVPVQLWQPTALWQQDQLSYSILSLYFGLLIGLLVYNLLLFMSLRDPLYLIYVCFVASMAVGQAGLTGFSSQFIWPDSPLLANLSPTGGVAAAGAFATWFTGRFLIQTTRRLRLAWLMPALGVIFLLTLLCTLFGSYHLAAWVVNINSMLFAIAALLLGCVSLYQRQPGSRFFVLAWSALFVGALVMALHNIGVLPSTLLTANALLIGSAIEMILLSIALADRIQGIQAEKEQAQANAIAAKQALLEAVRQSERLLEGRVGERTQALKQANEQLRESQRQLEFQAQHDALTGLANRKLLQDRLERAIKWVGRSGSAFALLVIDLDRFKEINDSHGHTAGDQVLVSIAQRMNALLRSTDTVARVGGDEFVLILEAVNNPAGAERIRDKLSAAIVQPIPLPGGQSVQVGASIGIALYPQDADSAEQLLHLADLRMYADKTPQQAYGEPAAPTLPQA